MTTRPDVSLIDVSSYLPGEPIGADYYAQFADSDELRENLMFRAPSFRHHVGPDETLDGLLSELAAQAARSGAVIDERRSIRAAPRSPTARSTSPTSGARQATPSYRTLLKSALGALREGGTTG